MTIFVQDKHIGASSQMLGIDGEFQIVNSWAASHGNAGLVILFQMSKKVTTGLSSHPLFIRRIVSLQNQAVPDTIGKGD